MLLHFIIVLLIVVKNHGCCSTKLLFLRSVFFGQRQGPAQCKLLGNGKDLQGKLLKITVHNAHFRS